MKKAIVLSKAEMRNVMGGTDVEEEVNEYGKCSVKLNCSNGSVECSSDQGKCRKFATWVQCDNDPAVYC
jgi:hypothetical protein